jgi:hypothetical protein
VGKEGEIERKLDRRNGRKNKIRPIKISILTFHAFIDIRH